jgi:inorganic pyrophosphatase
MRVPLEHPTDEVGADEPGSTGDQQASRDPAHPPAPIHAACSIGADRSTRHTGPMTEPRTTIEVIVEIPSGSRNKYEYDHERHRFVLDRILYSSVHYPCDYGFVDGTLADDGDPLDVLVVISEPTFPGCVVRARPVGVLDMRDDKGHDYKILAVAADDPRWDETHVMGDLSPHRLREIENFFQIYKELEGRPVEVFGWLGVDDAWRILDEATRAGERA